MHTDGSESSANSLTDMEFDGEQRPLCQRPYLHARRAMCGKKAFSRDVYLPGTRPSPPIKESLEESRICWPYQGPNIDGILARNLAEYYGGSFFDESGECPVSV